MPSAVDYFIERTRRRSKYFEDYLEYCRRIKERVGEKLGPVRVVVFGSVVRGDYNPALSDIDVLIITQDELGPMERAEVIRYVKNEVLGDLEAPFEIHVASEGEYEEWYKRFIDAWIEI